MAESHVISGLGDELCQKRWGAVALGRNRCPVGRDGRAQDRLQGCCRKSRLSRRNRVAAEQESSA